MDQLTAMRDTTVHFPVTSEWLSTLRAVSPRDVAADKDWAFAPVGVTTNMERSAINAAQAVRWGKAHGVPVLRWRRELRGPLAGTEANLSILYGSEKELWGYFVQGAPAMLMENISTARKLTNGTQAAMHSLCFQTTDDAAHAAAAVRGAEPGSIIDLRTAPLSVNVRVKMGAVAMAAWPPTLGLERTADSVVVGVCLSSQKDVDYAPSSLAALAAGLVLKIRAPGIVGGMVKRKTTGLKMRQHQARCGSAHLFRGEAGGGKGVEGGGGGGGGPGGGGGGGGRMEQRRLVGGAGGCGACARRAGAAMRRTLL